MLNGSRKLLAAWSGRGGLAGITPGLEIPGRPVARSALGLTLADFSVAHAGEEIPIAIVFGRMRLTKPIVFVHHVAGLGRPGGGRQPAFPVLARSLPRLQGEDIVFRLVGPVRARRPNPDIDELGLVLKIARHQPSMKTFRSLSRIEDCRDGRHIRSHP
jgi:hypothetical protein